jgi:hypothetical protein
MEPSKNPMRLLALFLAGAATAACAPAADDTGADCVGDKCDDGDGTAPTTACDGQFVDMSGRAGRVQPGSLGDPIANAIFKTGEGCPVGFEEVMNKLKQTDKQGCEGDAAGLMTRVVSERSQTLGKPDSYRAVITRTCGGRESHEVLFSLFGLSAQGALPEDVEIVALDETKGVFNFYVVEGGKWNFHGDSNDMLEGPGDDGKRRCASCHPGGGLVMKELESPWMHWEGDTTTPGAAELVEKHKSFMGSKSNGIELEGVVRKGNRFWNSRRLASLKKKGAKELLRPLFCTVEINLHNGSSSTTPVDNTAGDFGDLSRVPSDFLVDTGGLGFFSAPTVTPEDYRAQVAANGQRMAGSGGAQLRDKDGMPALDTVFDFAFPKRAIIDSEFVNELKTAGIVDEDLVKDVLMVDFTRQIFSSDRCDLLQNVPDLAEADLTPDKIRDGLVASLRARSPGATTPGGQLLASLENKTDAQAHQAKVQAFFTACQGRPQKELLADVMKVNSLLRNQARELPVMEFPESLPFDNLSTARGSRLDPKTCALTTSFVAVQ